MKIGAAKVTKARTRSRATKALGLPPEQLPLLRAEIEMLATDDDNLKKIAGAAALFISYLDLAALPRDAIVAAAILARYVDQMSDEGMAEALQLVRH